MEKDPFDQMVMEIQEKVLEEERRIYSPIVIEESRHPYHKWEMEGADGRGKLTGSCGDTMWFYLRVDGDRIVEASFETDGCGSSTAVASMMVRMTEGMMISDVLELTPDDLIERLGGLPEDSLHCADLALTTLFVAIEDLYAKGVVE